MIGKFVKVAVTAGVAAGVLLTPTVAQAAPLDGSQSATLRVHGAAAAYVYKSWFDKNAAGEWDGSWYAEPTTAAYHVRVYEDGVEVARVYYPGDGDSYDNVRVLSMKACNDVRCSPLW